MAHRPYLDAIVRKADAGNTEAQACMRTLSELSGPRGSGYWVCDWYEPPSEAQLRERRSLQDEQQHIRAEVMRRLM
jgi:hypothetical protein